MVYYVVTSGRVPGIYSSWEDCKAQVVGFRGQSHVKTGTIELAQSVFASKGASLKRQIIEDVPDEDLAPPKKFKFETTDMDVAQKEEPPVEVLPSEPGRIVVYTDGSCTGNGKQHAKAGCGVYWGNSDPRNVARRLPGPMQTNNRAEIYACILALKEPSVKGKPVEIRTDSMYTINCITKYAPKWMRYNWVKYGGEPVKNSDILAELYGLALCHGADVRWTYVEAHANIHGNEMADRLAKQGAK